MCLLNSFTYILLETLINFHLNHGSAKRRQGSRNTFLTTFVLSVSCDTSCVPSWCRHNIIPPCQCQKERAGERPGPICVGYYFKDIIWWYAGRIIQICMYQGHFLLIELDKSNTKYPKQLLLQSHFQSHLVDPPNGQKGSTKCKRWKGKKVKNQ